MSIPFLLDEISVASTRDDKLHLFQLLLSECSRSKNDNAYLHFLRAAAEQFSDDPVICIGTAHSIAIVDPESRQESLDRAVGALELAIRQNRLVKYTATELARISLLLEAYKTLERALTTLISERNVKRSEDSGYVFDFVDQIDPKRCDGDLLAQYKQLDRSKQRGR